MKNFLIKMLFPIIKNLLCAYINRALHDRLMALLGLRADKENSELETKIAFIHELIYINDNINIMESKEVAHETNDIMKSIKKFK